MTSPQGEDVEFLLVTDDPRLREEFRFALPTGAAARCAADARVAWKEMQTAVPTVVVVDIQSGSAGGFGLARDMNARSDLAEIPVVMLLERVQDAWLAKQAGAVSWILKPVPATALVRQCLELLARL